jgi:hypothetical protein
MSEERTIKPCPFCGGPGSTRDLDIDRAFCENKGRKHCPIMFNSMTVAEWNRRTPPPEVRRVCRAGRVNECAASDAARRW